jgi:hypothetical protein
MKEKKKKYRKDSLDFAAKQLKAKKIEQNWNEVCRMQRQKFAISISGDLGIM